MHWLQQLVPNLCTELNYFIKLSDTVQTLVYSSVLDARKSEVSLYD